MDFQPGLFELIALQLQIIGKARQKDGPPLVAQANDQFIAEFLQANSAFLDKGQFYAGQVTVFFFFDFSVFVRDFRYSSTMLDKLLPLDLAYSFASSMTI